MIDWDFSILLGRLWFEGRVQIVKRKYIITDLSETRFSDGADQVLGFSGGVPRDR